MDVPLYTVTGWDGAAIPLDAVLPVFGGYPDAPWDGSPHKLGPNEVYAFRFDNRASGNMGAIGGKGQNAASTYAGTPFLTAEVGDGIEDTYFRRPVVSADDVAAIVPVMLGSGVNLLGYYMFHGGRNPEGDGITLQESQRTGYPTDVPVKSYDFQAPLGEFGQERDSLRKLKLVHYFLADFGAALAPMPPHRPAALPSAPGDLSVPRVSARTLGEQGFVFFNNHVRGVTMPAMQTLQVELKLPGSVVRIPDKPIAVPSNAYGIWPVNLPVGTQTLRYSTAQLFKRVIRGGNACYLFFAIDGVPAEFAFDHATEVVRSPGFVKRESQSGVVLRGEALHTGQITLADGTTLVLMNRTEAEQVWRGDVAGTLLATAADAYDDAGRWTLESLGAPEFQFGLLGAAPLEGQNATPVPGSIAGIFHGYSGKVRPVSLTAKVTETDAGSARPPLEMGPTLSWRPRSIPLAPDDKDFATAARWKIELPALPVDNPALGDLFLQLTYRGDVARLYAGDLLLDDNFWNGTPWQAGLHEVDGLWTSRPQTLQLRILPLPPNPPMYLEGKQPEAGDPASLQGVQLLPQYRIQIQTAPAKGPR
jgi:hypothetical protein